MKSWLECSPDERLFWEKWQRIEGLTLSPNKIEAWAAAAKANKMLREKGLTRRDKPSFAKFYLDKLGVNDIDKVHGKRKSDIGRDPSHGKRPWAPDIKQAIINLGGSGSNQEIAEAVKVMRNWKVPESYKAIVRDQLQLHCPECKKYKPGNEAMFRHIKKAKRWALAQPHSPKGSNPRAQTGQTVQGGEGLETFAL